MRRWDLQELAAFACGLSEKQWEDMQNEYRESELDDLIDKKFHTGFDEFVKIAEALLMFTPQVQTAVTGKPCHAFVVDSRCILKSVPRIEPCKV